MKLIKPSYEILPQSSGLEGVFKQIEVAGRTCYKSNDKITTDSAKGFVERMIASGHGAMLEHGTVYLTIYSHDAITGHKYRDNKYSKYFEKRVREEPTPEVIKYITTNYRVLVENNWLDDLEYACEPTIFHEERVTVRFICDRGVSHEFVRHRVFSFAQESTRYCNYSKDKFNNEITIVAPEWLDFNQLESISSSDSLNQLTVQKVMEVLPSHEQEVSYLYAMSQAEQNYFKLLDKGWTPQQARSVLPNSLKTELVMTGFDSDWEGFFKLRDDSHAHPQAFELAHPLHEEFIKNGWL